MSLRERASDAGTQAQQGVQKVAAAACLIGVGAVATGEHAAGFAAIAAGLGLLVVDRELHIRVGPWGREE